MVSDGPLRQLGELCVTGEGELHEMRSILSIAKRNQEGRTVACGRSPLALAEREKRVKCPPAASDGVGYDAALLLENREVPP